jgi:hypothetical protein
MNVYSQAGSATGIAEANAAAAILDRARPGCYGVGPQKEVAHDLRKPDGTPRKIMATDKLLVPRWLPGASREVSAPPHMLDWNTAMADAPNSFRPA